MDEVVSLGGGRVGDVGCGGDLRKVNVMWLAPGEPYLAYRTVPPEWMVPEQDGWRARDASKVRCVGEPGCGWHQEDREEEEGTRRRQRETRTGQDGWTGSGWSATLDTPELAPSTGAGPHPL